MTKVLSLFDYPLPIEKWRDESVSMSWINCLQLCTDTIEPYAYVATSNQGLTKEVQRGINFSYECDSSYLMNLDAIVELNPNYVMINFSYYQKYFDKFVELKNKLTSCKFVLRIHHEPFRLVAQNPRFIDFLIKSDIVVSPLEIYNDFLSRVTPATIYTIPFGVDVDFFQNSDIQKKDYKKLNYLAACFSGDHPVKNHKLINSVFDKFSDYGVDIISDATKIDMRSRLNKASFFFQPSLSEASGSRVLFEAIAAGCYPITISNATSCQHVVSDCGGSIIPFLQDKGYLQGISPTFSDEDVNYLCDFIQSIEPKAVVIPSYLYVDNEIKHLSRIFSSSQIFSTVDLLSFFCTTSKLSHEFRFSLNSALDQLASSRNFIKLGSVTKKEKKFIEKYSTNSLQSSHLVMIVVNRDTYIKSEPKPFSNPGVSSIKLHDGEIYLARTDSVLNKIDSHYKVGMLDCSFLYYEHVKIIAL